LLHRTRPELRVTVPIHNKDLPPTFVKQRILKQADLSVEEFLELL
jgi:predicted RNA binding protein YcfA (HicA-like mRNA interferase family)